jgi:NAD(P)-dependent dehydrogenase (short-subunit alcohol dehydrogenase family)
MEDLNMQLAGKIALITGGARGLGKELARSFGESGMKVFICDKRYELASSTAQTLQNAGYSASAIDLDVSHADNVEQVVGSVAKECGQIDVIVNNAATDLTTSILEMPIEEWDRIMNTNLRGPFLMAKAALGVMTRQQKGHIINIVSTAAKRAWPNASAYHASKWGLLGLSHALHTEARQHNIKVTAVICGGMQTPFLLERFPDIDVTTLQDPKNVAQVIRFLLTLPEETHIPEIMILPKKETSWP